MLLQNEFEIDADLDQTWNLLTDLETIMPCLPGAKLESHDGDVYNGSVKIKVGPIGAHFRGTARFQEKDDTSRTALIAANGKDPKGQAAVNAAIRARLEQVTATRTRVLIDTDLDISGKMAQFGRGAIADVSNRIMSQFVANIGGLLDAPAAGGAAPSAAAPGRSSADINAGVRPQPLRVAEQPASSEASMDVMSLLVPMIKERYGQAIAGALSGFLLSWAVFGRRVKR